MDEVRATLSSGETLPTGSKLVKRLATPASFVPGDPRRINKPVGAISKATRTAQQIAKEILTPKVADACEGLVQLMREYRDLDDPCPECHRTPCQTCGRGVPADPCALCGRGLLRPEDTRLKAIQTILDRVGVGPQSSVKIETTNINVNFIRFMTDAELEQVASIIEGAKERASQSVQLIEETA
jgi:hypothetical protein